MTTSLTNPTAPTPAFTKPTGADPLTQLLETHRRVSAEIYASLRVRLVKEASVGMNPPPQAYTRRVHQLEKAFELYRQAEAKIELLVAHFGGSK